jgi:RNA polymerase sigma-70 factor (ECF subfamily)
VNGDETADASDDALVAAAQRHLPGDTRSFEILMRRHQGFVKANCRVITRSPADADDLAQEVFVKAYFGLRRFEGRAQFRSWLQRIKVNHCLNHLRRTKGATFLEIEDVGEGHASLRTEASADRALETAADRDRIVQVLDAMPGTLRIPLMLRDADGQSYDEIAEHLGIGLSAVKMRIKRGRAEFRTDDNSADDQELGAPIDELRDLSLPVNDGFGRLVRGKIERRILANDLLELIVRGPLSAILELLQVPFEWLTRQPKR